MAHATQRVALSDDCWLGHPFLVTDDIYFAVLTDILFWWLMGEEGWVFGRGEWGKVWCFFRKCTDFRSEKLTFRGQNRCQEVINQRSKFM